MEMYVDIDPLEHYILKISPIEVGDTLGGIPGLLHQAYATSKKTSQATFREVLEQAYGYPLITIAKAKIKGGIYTYPNDPDSYPLANFILTGREYGTLFVFQYQDGIVHISGSENFTTRMD